MRPKHQKFNILENVCPTVGDVDLGGGDDAVTGALVHGIIFDVDMFDSAREAVGNSHRDGSAVVDVERCFFDLFVE